MEVRNHRRVAANPNLDLDTAGAALVTVRTAIASCLLVAAAAALVLLGVPATEQASGAASCPNAGEKPTKLSPPQARKAIRCLINKRRANAGLGALDRDRRLQKAAQRHNNRMHGSGCFAHQCPGEPGLDTRVRNSGYLSGASRWSFGENLAWGKKRRGSPAKVVSAWMKSPGHRANILSNNFRDLGVGFDSGTPRSKRRSGGIFTVDFGLRAG